MLSIKRSALYIGILLAAPFLSGHAAFSQPASPTLAKQTQGNITKAEDPFVEARAAALAFIETVNDANRYLAMWQPAIAKEKIRMAMNLLPLILDVPPVQRRLTRVEFGGGVYADDLGHVKSYAPIETQSLEMLTRIAGPRWIKNTQSGSDSIIIYITLDLTGDKARKYLEQAEKDIVAGNIQEALKQLEQLADQIIKVDSLVPLAIQARDYITLANNYVRAGNFFGARRALESVGVFLDKMKDIDIYKPHQTDILSLRKELDDLQMAFAKMDAEQLKNADTILKKWQQQLSTLAELNP